MPPFEIIEIDEMIAACNGGGGPLGHPRIFMNLAPAGQTECPYCSRLFINRAMQGAATAKSGPDTGVATPSARGPGEEQPSESPAPRQSIG